MKPRSDQYLFLERAIDRIIGSLVLRALTLLAPPRRPTTSLNKVRFRRILLIKMHGIGNVLMLLPAIRALKKRFPAATLDFLTFESNAGLFEGIPDISQTFFIDRGSLAGTSFSILKLLPLLRHRGYDLVMDFEQFAYVSAIITRLVGKQHRIGFLNPTHSRDRAFSLPVTYSENGHMSRIFISLIRAAGVQADGMDTPSLVLPRSSREKTLRVLREAGIAAHEILILLHPGSSPNLTLRRWPVERFAALGDRLAKELGARILIGGDKSEITLAGSVVQHMTEHAVSVAGKLPLLDYSSLCRLANLVISNDTATVHLSWAVGTPVVGIYGPNTPFLYGPSGPYDMAFYVPMPCSPCLKNVNRKTSTCSRAQCMEAVTVDMVFSGICRRYFDASARLLPAFKKDRQELEVSSPSQNAAVKAKN